MRRYLYLILPVVAVLMSGCSIFGGGDDDTLKESDVIGRWWAQSQMPDAHEGDSIVFAFLNEPCEKGGTSYGKWGYTYDEGDDVHFADLMNQEEDGDYHGNGWFGWELDGKTIQTYQTFSSSDAVTPYQYKVSSVSGSQMVLTEGKRTYTLTRIQ